MSDSKIIDDLRRVAFLQDLPKSHLEELGKIARVVEYPARRTIFAEHEPAKEVFLVVSGEVSVVACEPGVGCRQLTTVGSGELLGWSPILERSRLTATAQTIAPTRTIAIDGNALRALCKQNTALGYEFMHRVADVLAERLLSTRVHLFKLSGPQLPEVVLESD
jgi:CRP-like cAMP-binding protein